MTEVFNLYCGESCHLKHDHQGVMVLGAVCCPLEKAREIGCSIRDVQQLSTSTF